MTGSDEGGGEAVGGGADSKPAWGDGLLDIDMEPYGFKV